MARHERFLAWQRAHALTLAVYATSRSWPAEEKFGLTSQARRAASSVAANIAEGAARFGPRELKRYLNISLGSLGELDYHLRLAFDLGITSEEDWRRLQELRVETEKLVRVFAKSLN
jgi:four helix bundle protein